MLNEIRPSNYPRKSRGLDRPNVCKRDTASNFKAVVFDVIAKPVKKKLEKTCAFVCFSVF